MTHCTTCPPTPHPSGLLWCGIGRHDGAVNAMLGTDVSGGFILGHILVGASGLMIALLVIVGGASLPESNVVHAGEAIIEIILPFVGIGRLDAMVVVASIR